MIARSDHLLLIGMMGSGKTSVGRRLAERLDRPFIDSDAQVEQATGKTVAQIFASEGEVSFRAAERAALDEACASSPPAVIAVAGGAVLDPENRERIRQSGRVIFLRATTATLTKRLGDGVGRPLLGADPPQAIERLEAERRPAYDALADLAVDVDGIDTDQVAAGLLEQLRERVTVDLGERTYDVQIGPGARNLLPLVLPEHAKRAAIVTQKSIGVEIDCPLPSTVHYIKEGEAAKALSTVEELCRSFAKAGLTRNDVVIAVGGGVVTDVGGFAAACYLRGTAVVHVSTTLLGQIDAAIGGKTGVNIPEGKNLVGAFFQPGGVICDTDLLFTLPEREWRSGLGEMAKYAFLGVDDLDRLPLVLQVARCVELKANVVAGDERESGRRAILNYGHTLAHALEAAGFADADRPTHAIDLRHGEAVAIGLVFSARLAQLLGRIDDDRVQRHVDVVRNYGLPDHLPPGVDLDELVEFMGRDKKATSGLTFVLDGPNGVEMVRDVDPSVVKEVLRQCEAASDQARSTDHRIEHVMSDPLVVLLSGPNLSLLGSRQPEIYGTETLDDHVATARSAATERGLTLEHVQSEHEGDLVKAVHGARGRADAIIVNAGALTHYGWSLHDALASFDGPIVELHLSNPDAREPWRHQSVLSDVVSGTIAGFGGTGYALSVEAVACLLRRALELIFAGTVEL